MTAHVCRSCAATEADGATYPTAPSGRVTRLVCMDCALAAPHRPRPATRQTRASYRASYRYRQSLAQGDLVDLLVPAP